MNADMLFQKLNLSNPPLEWVQGFDAAQNAMTENPSRFSKEVLIHRASEGHFPQKQLNELSHYLDFLHSKKDLLLFAHVLFECLFDAPADTAPNIGGWQLPALSETPYKGLLWTVVFLAGFPVFLARTEKFGIVEEQTKLFWQSFVRQTARGKRKYERYGLSDYLVCWQYLYYIPRLFTLGRLQFEIAPFKGVFSVWQHKETGAQVPLSTDDIQYDKEGILCGEDASPAITTFFKKTKRDVTGLPFDEMGRLTCTPVILPLAEYGQVLAPGDDAVSVHIPAGGKLSPAEVADSFERARKFFAKFFPQIAFKAFVCESWLLDTNLRQLLPATSNILAFQNEFRVVTLAEDDVSLFMFIFDTEKKPLNELLPTTPFQQSILNHVKNGGEIHFGTGIKTF